MYIGGAWVTAESGWLPVVDPALRGATDAAEQAIDAGERSPFIEVYAERVRRYMAAYELSVWQLAWIAAKNHAHAVHNPLAQYRTSCTLEEVLASPVIATPLTRLMCSPIADGAAAAIVVSDRLARRKGGRSVNVDASVLVSGHPIVDSDNEAVLARAAQKAYTAAGLAPKTCR